tara:strand:+ start:6253 stop:7794 length:1542 start_codon:yes stop_codon:yes gene_type:complete
MLYNSYIFIFLFLPVTLFGFHFLSKSGHYKLTLSWLVAASLFFYGWWNPIYIALLIGSAIFNYTIGYLLLTRSNKVFLYFGIIGNLVTLGYFKYANFFIDNINFFFDNNIILEQIILPLGISFFTFQQITFLVDTHLGKTKEFNFLQYCLFVTFFPQLISGPIVHHQRMMPQFTKKNLSILKLENLAAGFTTFVIGLFKKVFLADNIAVFATPTFDAAAYGFELTFFEAWGASLAYAFQLYFDFSGYSDMALGLGLMFGIALPFNFLSPFKSKNISEFWRCWHISLSTLIRDYLYYPISLLLTRYAMNKNVSSINLFILSMFIPTMFAFFWMGLWHGAGWHFVLFGLVQGVYITIYNLWIKLVSIIPQEKRIKKNNITDFISQTITFVAILFSFVIFRAENIGVAKDIIFSMLGFNGIEFSDMFRIGLFGAKPKIGILWILLSIFIVNFLPNSKEFILNKSKIFIKHGDVISNIVNKKITWKPNFFWGIIFVIMLTLSLMSFSNTSEFLYFQF